VSPRGVLAREAPRRSPHTGDLFVIAICALIVAVVFMVSVVALISITSCNQKLSIYE